MAFTDRNITCMDCGTEFVFTEREQEFYAQKGFASEPKRCPDCRRARKNSRGDDMGGGSRGGGGGYGEERQMYPATCASCGRETQVPFQPRGTRPVYCRDCFRTMAPSGGDGGRR